MVGAVLHGGATAASAQDPRPDTTRAPRDTTRARPDSMIFRVPAPADSAQADSARRARATSDSIRAAEAARIAADTIKTPLARAESPVLADIGEDYRWNRDEIFASGALSLGELLARIPGMTPYTSGWIAAPHTAAYMGDFRRLRVFYDGVELDPLDLRMGPKGLSEGSTRPRASMLDLSAIQLWTLEEIAVERAAEEVRVYLRSWRVERTIPYTRVDVATGDLSTNSYRGFFGRRFRNGGALQIGAQQYSTQDPRFGGDGDLLSLIGRLGWAKRAWSADAFLMRTRRTRTATTRPDAEVGIPALDGTRTDAYVRAGYGNPTNGRLWAQFLAASSQWKETSAHTGAGTTTPGLPFTGDTVDTTASRAQYLLTGGVRRWGASLSGGARLRVFDEWWFLSPFGRVSIDRGSLSLSAFAEHQVDDSTLRTDVTARFAPLRFLEMSASVGRNSPTQDSNRPTTLAARGEVGVRLGRLWVSGGAISLDTTITPAPVVYDTSFQPVAAGRRTAGFVTLRGPIWKAVGVDLLAMRWPTGDAYLPEYQVRSRLYLHTSWLSRFPNGNFNILAAVGHEYRTEARFPTSGEAENLFSTQYRAITTHLELRLYDAVLSWQYRNIIGEIYQMVPGYVMPRNVNYYGVRWDFFN